MTILDIPSPNVGVVSLNLQEVSQTMADLFSLLEAKNTDVGVAVAAFALGTARLLGPESQSVQDEVKFIQASMEWSGTYFAAGVAN